MENHEEASEYADNPKLDENRAFLDNNCNAHVRADILKITEQMGKDLKDMDVETLANLAAILERAHKWGHIEGEQRKEKEMAQLYPSR